MKSMKFAILLAGIGLALGAFGVSAMAVVLGVVLTLIGLALRAPITTTST